MASAIPGADDQECRKRWLVPKIERLGSLEIDEDLIFERRQWGVQRAGWVVILLIVLAGLVGLLGPGPVSTVKAVSGALTVEYERVVRKQAPTELHVRLAPGAAQDGEVALFLDQAYLAKVGINSVIPEPIEMEATADGVVFRFAIEQPEQPAEIVFAIEPSEPGMTQGRLGLLEGAELTIDQLIFP
jgi:hypothetical protein